MDIASVSSTRFNVNQNVNLPAKSKITSQKSEDASKKEDIFNKSERTFSKSSLLAEGSSGEISPEEKKSEEMPFVPEWENKTDSDGKKELTILFYINGQYDDINKSCSEAFLNLETAGSTEDINVVAQLGRNPYKSDPSGEELGNYHVPIDKDWAGIKRYEVVQDNHEESAPPSLQEYLDIEKAIPKNSLLQYAIGNSYWEQGDKDKAKEYFDRARELGVSNVLSNPHTPENSKVFRELNTKLDEISGPVGDNKVFKSKMVAALPIGSRMSDSANLEDFIHWGMKTYPSEHYMVVVMAHGGAWIGSSEMSPNKMGNAIEDGVAESNKETGRNDKIDALIFNSCYMGNVEAASEFDKAADVSVISENFAKSRVFKDWPMFVNVIQKDIDSGNHFDAKKFASNMVDYYKKRETEIKEIAPDFAKYNSAYLTLTAIDNEKFGDLVDSWKTFNEVCKKEGVTDKQLFSAVKNAKNYPSGAYNPSQMTNFYSQLHDMGSIMDEVKKMDKIPTAVKEVADGVKENLKNLIINEQHEGMGMEGSSGLSVWGPTNFADYNLLSEKYVGFVPEFVKDSGWMARLDEAASNIPTEVKNGIMSVLDDRRVAVNLDKLQGLSEKSKESLKNLGPLTKEDIEKLRKFSGKSLEELSLINNSDSLSKEEKQMVTALLSMDKREISGVKWLLGLEYKQMAFLKSALDLGAEEVKNPLLLVDLNDNQKERLSQCNKDLLEKESKYRTICEFGISS